ncbi:MAG: hypothetical protein IJS19_02960 [Muribaculaceae bacterium]|nr:hypothetical protein [Muribaculaceae bacterium]
MNENKPIFLFSVKPSGYRESGGVYDPEGIAPTFKENHGEVLKIIVYERGESDKVRAERGDESEAQDYGLRGR